MSNSAEIDRRIERLREAYGDFPVESAEYEHPPDTYDRVRELHDRGIPGATRAWVERGDEALLVREERRPDSWGVPGGLIDPGEPVDQAGEREVREETGIDCEVVDVTYAHRATRRHEDGDREPIEELAVVVIAEYVDGTPRPQEGEVREVEWWSELPENVHSPADRIWVERFE